MLTVCKSCELARKKKVQFVKKMITINNDNNNNNNNKACIVNYDEYKITHTRAVHIL